MGSKYLLDLIDQVKRLMPKTSTRRREFLRACAALGIAPTLLTYGTSKSFAAAKEIVVANWGGDATKGMKAAFGPYTQTTGVPIAFDTGPLEGKIKAMVDNRQAIWDIMDVDGFSAISLGRQGYLRPIDYSIVGGDQLVGTTSEFGTPSYVLSYVLTYDARKFGSNPPRTWADFWDVKKFSGKRGLWKWMGGSLEAALMADGVARDKVFPMDIPRALHKLETLKEHVVLWDSAAESQQMLRNHEVSMACIWSTRASLLKKETNNALNFTWNEGVTAAAVWAVPKGNPAGDEVWKFLAFLQSVEPQLALLRSLGRGPITNKATAAIPADLRQANPGTPENFAIQCKVDNHWWANNYEATLRKYTSLFSA